MADDYTTRRLQAAARNPSSVLLCYKDALALAGCVSTDLAPRELLDEALQRASDFERDLRVTTAENRQLRDRLASLDGRSINGAHKVDCPRACGRLVDRKSAMRPNGCCHACYKADLKAGIKKRKSRDAGGATEPAPE
jgi:hypothetical protein